MAQQRLSQEGVASPSIEITPEDRCLVIAPGAGQTLPRRGASLTFKVTGNDTDGAFALLESLVTPGAPGPRRHVHRRTRETFYLLDGELTFEVGERTVKAPAGTVVTIPPGVIHTFANRGRTPAKYLTVLVPAGFEQFFPALAAARAARGGDLDPASIEALGHDYDQYLA
jgi:mannose-6-phosphate isomerase-like protein (cupin superfamily)